MRPDLPFSDVTSDQSVLTFNIYDRAVEDQGFLGRHEIKPLLVNDHTVDQWYKYVSFVCLRNISTCLLLRILALIMVSHDFRLRPYENEVVTGEMRVQITYEQFKVSGDMRTNFLAERVEIHPYFLIRLHAVI